LLLEPLSKDEKEEIEEECSTPLKVTPDSKPEFEVKVPKTCTIENLKRYILTIHKEPFILENYQQKNSDTVEDLLDNCGSINIIFELQKFNLSIARKFYRPCDGSTAEIKYEEDWRVSDLLQALSEQFESEAGAKMDFTFLNKVLSSKNGNKTLRELGMFRSLALI